jgi:hypothetical protein
MAAGSKTPIVAFIAIALAGLAGNYTLDTMRRQGREAATRVDQDLRLAEEGLADLRAAEAAYVAVGPATGTATTALNNATAAVVQLDNALGNLIAVSGSADARPHYDAAVAAVADIKSRDSKARDLAATGNGLVAADVVLVEGGDAFRTARAELASARTIELAGFETKASQLGWIGLGGNAVVLLLGLLLFAAARKGSAVPADAAAAEGAPSAMPGTSFDASEPISTTGLGALSPAELEAVADLCVDLGRATHGDQFPALLERMARVLDARGLVVWIADAGDALRPMLAHGYSDRVLQRMGSLPVSGDNVTSLAFRTASPQAVAGSGNAQGAIAVPLVAGSGCVGVLAAEVPVSGAGDHRVAIARLAAAQLSTIVAPAAAAAEPPAPESNPAVGTTAPRLSPDV